ncbi:MAG TPA: hypothetical protein VMJ34_21975 [Bryobacteraceae bacterium]|nr:hypothetical protein [Bryobacteraceae bacterium]
MRRAVAAFVLGAAALAAQASAEPEEFAAISAPATPEQFFMSRSGTLAGAVCADKKLRLWSLPDGKPLREFDLGPRSFAALSGDGQWVAAADFEGDVRLWNAGTGAEQMHLRLPMRPSAMALSADGRRFAIAPVSQPVQVYDTATGNKLFELPRVVGGTTAITFSDDVELLATGDADTSVRIFDARSGAMLDHNTDFLLEPFAVAFTPDRKHLFAGGADKTIIQIDIALGEVVRKSTRTADPIGVLDVSPDGRLVAAALMHADGFSVPAPVLVSEVATGKQVQQWLPPSAPIGGGWTSDGHLIAATLARDSIRLWRIR